MLFQKKMQLKNNIMTTPSKLYFSRNIIATAALTLFISCISTKSTIQNIDNTAVLPKLYENAFIIEEYANDSKYGFNENYPINLGFYKNENSNTTNIKRFFNGLISKSGETLSYKKIGTCCPYPSKNNGVGAGTLDIYEVSVEGKTNKWLIYINIYEKGKILCPNGFEIKKRIM